MVTFCGDETGENAETDDHTLAITPYHRHHGPIIANLPETRDFNTLRRQNSHKTAFYTLGQKV